MLTAKASGQPTPQTCWIIAGELVADEYITNTVDAENNILTSSLNISDVTIELDGESVELLLENAAGRCECLTLLKITEREKPQNIVRPLPDEVTGLYGESLELTCQIAVPFAGTVEWQKNDIRQSQYRMLVILECY